MTPAQIACGPTPVDSKNARIAHSLVQALWNRVAVRFALFGASTAALLLLAVAALRAVA